ncbi:MAG: 2-C-methyl-D-erythritol 4-phosphate cytidylyltransferase [Proteobacteria bacterium]|nr:2-C-methyl-D-erythritol 4-phosphate cytidylyltransferase [Pseudomonadota bacterium]
MKAAAIIPAAGSGKRMGSSIQKPYIILQGMPLLAHTLRVFAEAPDIAELIVTVSPGQEDFCRQQVVKGCAIAKPVTVLAGGDRRQDSVRNGLAAVSDSVDLVMIHDGARPFVTVQMICDALEITMRKRATTMAVPVKDTVTMVAKDTGLIQQTLDRDSLYLIQTPQTFERELICEAHRRARAEGFAGTDDASLVERLGVPVSVIMGSYDNIKITTQEDLLFAEAILQRRLAK